ncbi:MAG: type IV pilus secretin PilQ [Bdellovibrio sp.]
MKNGIFRLLLAALLSTTMACSTTPPAAESGGGLDGDATESVGSGGIDEFAEFEAPSGGAADPGSNPEESIENELAAQDTPASNAPTTLDNTAIEKPAGGDEFAEFDAPQSSEIPPPADTSSQEAPPSMDVAAIDPGPEIDTPPMSEPMPEPEPLAEAPAPEPAPVPEVAEEPAPVTEEPAGPVAMQSDSGPIVNITSIQYRANDNGGTVVIEGSGPLSFNPRMNAETNQFIVEVPNSRLPRKLKRPFNTRDFAGTIGSIDAYQGKGSTTARIVVQLRAGAAEPVVQAEGNTLFVVAVPPSASQVETTDDDSKPAEMMNSNLMATENIEEFLAGNQAFYGKRLSIETDDAEVRDVFRLISEESNVNLIISDEVKGKVSLKLKNVPWDQALVMVMKARKLGYTRVGNVLRIAPIADIKTEEEDAIKFMAAKKANATFKVRTLQVNYAKVEELEKQLKPLLSARGSVIADTRTSSIIVTDIDENMVRAEKLVRALDVPPQQVMIEGKIVEASEDFERGIGVNWTATGRQAALSGMRGAGGAPLRANSNFGIQPSLPSPATFGLNFSLGTLDILGDLNATLSLFERQGLVKVVSSPRVVTLHNEVAEINQTQELPLITATVAPNGTTTPIVNFKPVKLRLGVTPQVTNDGAVIMAVDVSREIAGAVVDQRTQAFPINARTAKTKVIVKNSQTAVIGGIYQNDSQVGETRVPGLGTLPVIGWLFKSRSTRKNRTELLIFITPRILGQLEGAPTPSTGDGMEL